MEVQGIAAQVEGLPAAKAFNVGYIAWRDALLLG